MKISFIQHKSELLLEKRFEIYDVSMVDQCVLCLWVEGSNFLRSGGNHHKPTGCLLNVSRYMVNLTDHPKPD